MVGREESEMTFRTLRGSVPESAQGTFRMDGGDAPYSEKRTTWIKRGHTTRSSETTFETS